MINLGRVIVNTSYFFGVVNTVLMIMTFVLPKDGYVPLSLALWNGISLSGHTDVYIPGSVFLMLTFMSYNWVITRDNTFLWINGVLTFTVTLQWILFTSLHMTNYRMSILYTVASRNRVHSNLVMDNSVVIVRRVLMFFLCDMVKYGFNPFMVVFALLMGLRRPWEHLLTDRLVILVSVVIDAVAQDVVGMVTSSTLLILHTLHIM